MEVEHAPPSFFVQLWNYELLPNARSMQWTVLSRISDSRTNFRRILDLVQDFLFSPRALQASLQTSNLQAPYRTTGVAMSIKKSDVKNHLSVRRHHKLNFAPAGKPDGMGSTRPDQLPANTGGKNFAQDFTGDHTSGVATDGPSDSRGGRIASEK
jgi:hypothetical protein